MSEPRGGRLRLVVLVLALMVATAPNATAIERHAPTVSDSALGAAVGSDERIADLAFDLDYDLERMFRFVADEIRYEPYAGILRGAVGALDAGAGNSVDKSLLLAALLDESVIPHRFVRGALDETAAASLVESALMDADEATAAAEIALAGGPYPTELELTPPEPADPQLLAANQAAADAALQASGQQVDDSVALVTTALADAGIELGGTDATFDPASVLPEAEREGHTWLEVASGAEWLELDPSLGAEAVIGDTLTSADETLDALPDELRHVVRFEVLLERIRGEGLETIPVIEYSAFADELAGGAITFTHARPDALEELGSALSRLMGGDAQASYHAVLGVPGGTIVSTEDVAIGAGADGGGGLLDDSGLFDDLASPGAATADGEASAEWLVVTVESPGAEPVVARRPVFDRVPPEIRYGGEPTAADVQPAEVLSFPDGDDLDFAPMLGVDAFAISTGPLVTDALFAYAASPDADAAAFVAASYLGLRDVVAAQEAIDDGVITFVDRPGVVSFSFDIGTDGDEPTLSTGMDIWHRSLGAMPTEQKVVSTSQARIEAGVVEHVAERLTLPAGPPEGPGPVSAVGVSRVFEAAADAGVPTVVLQGSLPDGTVLDPTASALIEEALQAGDAVIMPAQPVDVGGRERLAWWRVDPLTGTTSDMTDDGTGSETVEYSISLRAAMCSIALVPLGLTIAWSMAKNARQNIIFGSGAGLTTAAYAVVNEMGAKPFLACATGRGPAL